MQIIHNQNLSRTPGVEFHQNRAGGGSLQENGVIVIRHFKEDLTINRKEGSGRKKGFQSSKTAKKEGIRGSDHHKKYDGGDFRKN